MAQNDIQKYTNVEDFYANVRNPLEQWYNIYHKLEKMANFLNSADAGTYPTIPTGTLTDMGQLRTTINTYLSATDVQDMLTEVKTFIRI